jgi:hypothetical protein
MGRSGGEFHAVPSGPVYWDLLAEWVQKDSCTGTLYATYLLPLLFTPHTPHIPHPTDSSVQELCTLRLLSYSRFPPPACRFPLIALRSHRHQDVPHPPTRGRASPRYQSPPTTHQHLSDPHLRLGALRLGVSPDGGASRPATRARVKRRDALAIPSRAGRGVQAPRSLRGEVGPRREPAGSGGLVAFCRRDRDGRGYQRVVQIVMSVPGLRAGVRSIAAYGVTTCHVTLFLASNRYVIGPPRAPRSVNIELPRDHPTNQTAKARQVAQLDHSAYCPLPEFALRQRRRGRSTTPQSLRARCIPWHTHP